jgi:hypothetical protein
MHTYEFRFRQCKGHANEARRDACFVRRCGASRGNPVAGARRTKASRKCTLESVFCTGLERLNAVRVHAQAAHCESAGSASKKRVISVTPRFSS